MNYCVFIIFTRKLINFIYFQPRRYRIPQGSCGSPSQNPEKVIYLLLVIFVVIVFLVIISLLPINSVFSQLPRRRKTSSVVLALCPRAHHGNYCQPSLRACRRRGNDQLTTGCFPVYFQPFFRLALC